MKLSTIARRLATGTGPGTGKRRMSRIQRATYKPKKRSPSGGPGLKRLQ